MELTWQIELHADQPVLRVAWRETGLKNDGKPVANGFGHSVLTTLCKRSLDAEIDYKICSDSVSWIIEIPGTLFSKLQCQ